MRGNLPIERFDQELIGIFDLILRLFSDLYALPQVGLQVSCEVDLCERIWHPFIPSLLQANEPSRRC